MRRKSTHIIKKYQEKKPEDRGGKKTATRHTENNAIVIISPS